MNISERVHAFIQPVKTSFGTAVTKASETVKKASEIASKILKVLFTPVTYLYHAVKSLLNRMSKNPAPAAQPEDSIRRQSDAADLDRNMAAVKIQTLGRGYIARKLQKAEKAKAEVFRPAAATFLANITQQAVAEYANRTQVSHRAPTSLSEATSIPTAQGTFRPANRILVPVLEGGSGTDYPPLSRQRQNKSARRRGQ